MRLTRVKRRPRAAASAKIASAKSAQVASPEPVMWKTPNSAGDASARTLAATASSAVARSRAEVGLPLWSATTETSSRISLSESIVRTKIRAVRAEEPGGAHDHAVGAALGDQPFAEQFRAPVGASRPGRIVLAVGAIERPVEHVVGRQLQQGRADPVGGFRHMARPLAIDGDGEALLRLRPVDGGIGGGVDHHVRPRGLKPIENSRAILEQEYAAAKQDDLERAPRLLD